MASGKRLPLDSSLAEDLYPLRLVVIQAIKAKFTRWKVGEKVLARKDGRTFTIRKSRLPSPAFPLNSACCAVPAEWLATESDICPSCAGGKIKFTLGVYARRCSACKGTGKRSKP